MRNFFVSTAGVDAASPQFLTSKLMTGFAVLGDRALRWSATYTSRWPGYGWEKSKMETLYKLWVLTLFVLIPWDIVHGFLCLFWSGHLARNKNNRVFVVFGWFLRMAALMVGAFDNPRKIYFYIVYFLSNRLLGTSSVHPHFSHGLIIAKDRLPL